jgi:putative chitinase
VNHPELAADPKTSLRLACDFWKARKINHACDKDDVVAVTKIIDGGDNGLDERRALTDKAKKVLGIVEGVQISGAAPVEGHSTLRRGSSGDEVKQLQTALKRLGYEVGVDGDFGPGTEAAVKSLQSARKLATDGIVGNATWALLDA